MITSLTEWRTCCRKISLNLANSAFGFFCRASFLCCRYIVLSRM